MKQGLLFIFLLHFFCSRSQGITATVITSSASCSGTCNGSATVTASGGNAPYSYFWSPSGGTGATASALCAGSYSCMVTDSDGRTVTAVGQVQQPPPIMISFSTSGQSCNTIGSATVVAYNSAAPYTYSWSSGSGSANIITSVPAGVYSVTITDALPCSRVFTLAVPSSAVPFLSIAGPSTLCGNSYNTFTVNGGSAYLWSNGSTTSQSTYYISNPAAQYTAAVSVTGTQAVTGCTATLTHTLQVYKPNLTVSGPDTLCLHHPVTFTAAGATNYLWNGVQTGSVLSVITGTSPTYAVVGVDAQGCSDTAIHVVTVLYSPAFSVNSGSICQGTPFVITPTATGAWPTTPVTMSVTSSASTIVQAFGTVMVLPVSGQQYSVTLSTSGGCASTVAVASVSVAASPTIFAVTPSVCAGEQATLSPGGALNYTVTALAPGHLVALGTNAAGCLSDSLHVYPVIYPLPTVTAAGGSICAGSSLVVSPSGAAAYSISGNSFTLAPLQTTSYSVSGISAMGCESASPAIVTVTVIPLPQVSMNSGSICAGEDFVFYPSGASSYTISGGTFTVSPPVTTSYSLTGSVNGCGSSNVALETVIVAANPTVTAIPSQTTICRNEKLNIQAYGALSYSLNGASTNVPFSVTPDSTLFITISGENLSGCRDSFKVKIIVEECLGILFHDPPHGATVFPNPGEGLFEIRSDQFLRYRVFDGLGHLLIEQELYGTGIIDLRGVPLGIYYLELQSAAIRQNKKLVVQRPR
jgi:hypothetical protein